MDRGNIMFHKIELKGEENPMFARLYLDGAEVEGVRGVEFEQFVDEFPRAIVHLAGFPDVSTLSDVMYVANEEGVEKATKYLRESIEKDEALRDEFKSRILSAIDENTDCFESEKLANKILDVIFRD
jgi:hypothetical protein